MQKLTKIIATIGPSSDSPQMIEKLIKAGVNVFRFNFKHSEAEWHSERIERVNKIAKKLGVHIGTLIDLQGPEIRINMPDDRIHIKKGELLIFGEEVYEGREKGFSITHPQIIEHLSDGQLLMVDDGYYTFRVVKKDKKTYLKSETTGVLPTRKSMNIPGAEFPFPVLIDRDFEGLKLASRHAIDFIALSMVRNSKDLRTVRREAKKYGVTGKLVAKIETQKALDDIENIIDASDGIMIARGDLGVEIPIERVPYFQKMIIRNCMIQGKFVITATQMLQTMIENPFPTRAEISDIANAVYDLTDCIMLSGETASGQHPLGAVQVMDKTATFYEPKTDDDIRNKIMFSVRDTTALICDAAFDLYRDYVKANQDVCGFMVFTQSGHTATQLSRYRPKVPIYTFTPSSEVCEALSVNFAVEPLVFAFKDRAEVTQKELARAVSLLKKNGHVKERRGKLIVIHGDQWGRGAGATTIRII